MSTNNNNSENTIKPFERNIAIGAVVIGLAAFPFLLGKCSTSDLSLDTKSSVINASPATTQIVASTGDHAELAKLQAELDQAYGHIDVAQDEMTDARNKNYALQEEIERLEGLQGNDRPAAPVVVTEAAPVEEVAVAPAGPDPQIAILAAQLATLKTSSSSSLSTVNAKLKDVQAKLATTTADNQAKQAKIAELNQIISKDDKAKREQNINKTIKSLRDENTELRRLQTKLEEDSANANKKFKNQLKKAGAPYQGEIKDLKGKLAKLRKQSVFASSSADLEGKSGQLFKRLQGLENQTPEQLAASYQTIEKDLQSNDMTRVKFGTGSVELDQVSQSKIDAVLKDIKEDDRFLIVGYASNQGNKSLNEKLSSNRAKAVANRVLAKIGSGNAAKAVYLGETTRFGATTENQCVELWKIRK